MIIDITKIVQNQSKSLDINDNVIIPKHLLIDSRIDKLTDVVINGKIILDEENDLLLDARLSGTMTLKDDVTLEPVEYKFNTEFEENLEKNENLLDITDILWQNILVEIPSKVRATSQDIELSGNGWRVISEETYNQERDKSNNPFSNLGELLKIKEDK